MKKFCAQPSAFLVSMILALPMGSTTATAFDLSQVERPDNDWLVLQSAIFDPVRAEVIDGDPTYARAATESSSHNDEEAQTFIVQFDGPISPAIHSRINALGGDVLDYIPMHALLVRGDHGMVTALRDGPDTRWIGPMSPIFKIAPALQAETAQTGEFVVSLFRGANGEDLSDDLESLGITILDVDLADPATPLATGPRDHLLVECSADQLHAIATFDDVQWIDRNRPLEHRNSETRWVLQANEESNFDIWRAGLYGKGQVIGHIDGQIDRNHCSFEDTVDPGPNHRKIVGYRGSYGSESHGTHTAATAAGDARNYGGGWGDQTGFAFGARISHTIDNLIRSNNLDDYLLDACDDGAAVHTNSWGNDWSTSYTSHCQQIDDVSYSVENTVVCFAATNERNLKTPENAKNVMAVVATDRAPGQDSWCTGGQGPTTDGRRKPDVMAPGCSTVSARANTSCSTTSMSGTSMASPAVAGALAIIAQYFDDGYHPSGAPVAEDAFEPSGALMRATLINGAQNISGVSGYPSNKEGWGRVELEESLYLTGDARSMAVVDRRHAQGLATNEKQDAWIDLAAGEPLRVTMAFNDYPAAVNASYTPINDLDLFVRSPSGTIYSGNNFSNGQSTPGIVRDAKNNIEQIHVNSPEAGRWGVRVVAPEVQMGNAQGWALVVSGKSIQLSPIGD